MTATLQPIPHWAAVVRGEDILIFNMAAFLPFLGGRFRHIFYKIYGE